MSPVEVSVVDAADIVDDVPGELVETGKVEVNGGMVVLVYVVTSGVGAIEAVIVVSTVSVGGGVEAEKDKMSNFCIFKRIRN